MQCVFVSDLKTKTFTNGNGTTGHSRFYELTLLNENGYPSRERVDEQILINMGFNKPSDLLNKNLDFYYSKRPYFKDNQLNYFYFVSLIKVA